MHKQRSFFPDVLVFASIMVFAVVAQAETLVFIEADSIGGTKETAAELGKIGKLSELAGAKQGTKDTLIVAGRLDNRFIAPLVKAADLKVDTKWIGKQGFYIKTLKDGKILVTADTKVGVLYGLMELRDRIADDGVSVLKQKFDVKDRPVFTIRSGRIKKRANYASFWAEEQQKPTGRDRSLFLYTDSPEIFPNEEMRKEHIRKVQRYRKSLKKKIATADAYGAKVYLFMYQPTLPYWGRKPFAAAHPEVNPKRRYEWWHPFMCPSQQASKDVLYKKFRNLFREVPGIGGIILNIGEHCQSIYPCGCDKCKAQPYEERLVEYLMLIRKAMHESTPDARIYLRPWGCLNHGLGKDRKKFLALAKKLPADICFWSKVTVPPGGDYLWNDYFNPFIKMPRMETMGWDVAHPNMNQPSFLQLCYTGPKLHARAIKLAKLGIKGQANCGAPDKKESLYEPGRLASAKIAWDPYRFDSDKFLLKWANKRFGKEAGPLVTDALKDTYKITNAFIALPTNTNWFHILNFVKDKKTHCYSATNSAEQTPDVKNVNEKTLAKVLAEFKLAEAIKIAENAEKKLTEALALKPKNKTLKRFWMMAKATAPLARFYHNYHYALIYNNMSQATTGEASRKYHELAVEHIKKAYPDMKTYLEWMHKIHPIFNAYFEQLDTKWDMGVKCPRIMFYGYGQPASVSQQCRNGYHRLVMESTRAEKYPYMLCEAENCHTKIGYKRYAPYSDEMKWQTIYPKLLRKWKGKEFVFNLDASRDKPQSLPAIVSPWILPKLRVKFRGDLSKGGMLVVRYVPLGGKARERQARKSILKVALDGKEIKTLTDIATNDTMEDNEFIRYVELPAASGTKHELTLTSPAGCTGTEFYFMRIYTPTEQKFYLPNSNPYKSRMGFRLWSYEY
ncbi:MAG: hypothetical protein K8S55_03695 [Phycisphaerae bacterium]|nr:hypothetical protein [Phycisphaerae bacterium]